MIKLMLLGALFGASGYLGILISKVYDQKELFFEELVEFLNNTKNEISFFKTDIVSLLSKYQYKSYLQQINQEILKKIKSDENLELNQIEEIISKYANLEQKDFILISQMYYDLGKLGYYEQLEKIEYYISQIKISMQNNQNRAVKMKPFCKKMGFLIGLLVCIVLF